MATACFGPCEKGNFCDHGTRACETCDSICDPLRNTMEYCRSVLECKDYHHPTTALSSEKSSPFGQPSALVVVTILGLCLITAVVVVVVVVTYRRRRRQTTTPDYACCWRSSVKNPVPISSPEQDATERIQNGGNPFIFRAPNGGNSTIEMVPLKIHTAEV